MLGRGKTMRHLGNQGRLSVRGQPGDATEKPWGQMSLHSPLSLGLALSCLFETLYGSCEQEQGAYPLDGRIKSCLEWSGDVPKVIRPPESAGDQLHSQPLQSLKLHSSLHEAWLQTLSPASPPHTTCG